MITHSIYMSRCWAVAIAILAQLFAAAACSAQNPGEISVHVNAPATVYVGDAFDLQILVSGSRNVDRPAIPESPDYDVAYRGPIDRSSSTTIIVNGKISRQDSTGFAHVFSVTARRTGVLVVPSFPVICDGRSFPTREVRINALEPSQTADFRLELTPEKPRIYAGEPIRVSLTWLLGKPVKDYAINFPSLPPHAELLPAPDPRAGGAGSRRDTRFIEIPLGGETAIATVSRRDLDGRQVDAVTIDRILIAHEPGILSFAPARADFNAVVGQRQRRFMDSPFDDLSILERQSTVTKPFDIEVLPLPTAGRPADFSGLVGSYSLTASAEPADVSVGEPINLRITVNGPPPHSLIPLIDLNTQPAIASRFRVPRDPSLPLFTPVGAMFTYPIRARSAEQKQIPPVELSYFDTAAGAYQIARSAPITINVRPSTGVDIDFDDEGELAVAATTAKPADRVDSAPLALNAASFDLGSAITRPATVAILTAPPAALAAVWLGLAFRRHSAADPARSRRRRAVRRARTRIARLSPASDAASQASAVSHALTDLAADWFDRPAGTLTSDEALTLFRAHTGRSTDPIAQLLTDCDCARFGASPGLAADSQHDEPLAVRSRAVLAHVADLLGSRA